MFADAKSFESDLSYWAPRAGVDDLWVVDDARSYLPPPGCALGERRAARADYLATCARLDEIARKIRERQLTRRCRGGWLGLLERAQRQGQRAAKALGLWATPSGTGPASRQ